MDLQILLIQAKFASNAKIVLRQTEKEAKSLIEAAQPVLTVFEFGHKLLVLNSNLLLQGILQNRYQFKSHEYWFTSRNKEPFSRQTKNSH